MFRNLMMLKKWMAILLLALGACTVTQAWAKGPGGGATTPTGVYDTSFAVEYEYSCLTGGCHETNTALVDSHKASYMTHVMVKCNACHGTHTAAEVGKAKQNLTGYVAGMGATGYKVPKDRCVVCHSAASGQGHPNNPGECLSCHSPHQFAR